MELLLILHFFKNFSDLTSYLDKSSEQFSSDQVKTWWLIRLRFRGTLHKILIKVLFCKACSAKTYQTVDVEADLSLY